MLTADLNMVLFKHGPDMVAGGGQNVIYDAFAAMMMMVGHLTSGNITIGAKDIQI